MKRKLANHARLPCIVVLAFLALASARAEQFSTELPALSGSGFEFHDVEVNTTSELISWPASPEVPLIGPEPEHSLGIFSPDGYYSADARLQISTVPEPAPVALAFLAIIAFVFARAQRGKARLE